LAGGVPLLRRLFEPQDLLAHIYVLVPVLDNNKHYWIGVDISSRALEIAQERLSTQSKNRLQLIHGSPYYRDKRLYGYDAAAVVEVIEHFDLARLAAFERILFAFTRPKTVIITTPNIEYNVKFENAEKLRHSDHRFEWTRKEFSIVGAPTQMGIFSVRA